MSKKSSTRQEFSKQRYVSLGAVGSNSYWIYLDDDDEDNGDDDGDGDGDDAGGGDIHAVKCLSCRSPREQFISDIHCRGGEGVLLGIQPMIVMMMMTMVIYIL